jgi:hypothetical protein
VLALSCVFYTVFLFDTLGDEVGFAGAFWVLIVVPLLPIVALAVHTAEDLRSKGATGNPASSADSEGGVALADRLSGTVGAIVTEVANGIQLVRTLCTRRKAVVVVWVDRQQNTTVA